MALCFRSANVISIIPLIFIALISSAQVTYTDVAQSVGISATMGDGVFGGGLSFCDFNGDGWDDLTFCSETTEQLYIYENKQGVFEPLSPSPVTFPGESKQVIWVDFDNDGDKDLFTTFYNSGIRLYENTGELTFVDITLAANIINDNSIKTFGGCWGDYNNDGWLDFYVVKRSEAQSIPVDNNILYENQGDGTFSDVTAAAGVPGYGAYPFCAAFIDFNNDGWQDIYVINDRFLYPNVLYKNMGNGTFADISASSGADIAIEAMCVTSGDYDGNGFMDIYVTNTWGGNKLLKNNGDETYTEVADALGVAYYQIGWGSSFLDYDLDKDLDLYVCGTYPFGIPNMQNDFYENQGNGDFSLQLNAGFAGDTTASYSCALGDFNNDGYPDIAISNEAPDLNMLWKNSGNTSQNWLKIALEGTISNRDGIGSWIEVYTNGEKQLRYTQCGVGYLAQYSTYEMLGIGSYTLVDSVIVKWLSGHIDKVENVCANTILKVVENSETITTPQLTPMGNTIICEGESVTLTTGSFESYLWSNGATTQSITVSQPGSYTVQTTNSLGNCGTSAPLGISVLPGGEFAQAGESVAICEGETVTLNGNGGINYQWIPATSLQHPDSQSPVAYPASTTTYTVTATNANGCTDTDQVTILVHPSPTANAGMDQQICEGETTTMTATGGSNYLWSNGETNPQITTSPALSTTFSLTVTDINNCSDTDDVLITVFQSPTAIASPDQLICPGEMATLTATGGDEYLWSDGQAGDTIYVNPIQSSVYAVTVTDENGCSNTDEISIEVASCPLIVKLTAYLEGVYIGSGMMSTALETGEILVNAQPFNRSPWHYSGTESVLSFNDLAAVAVDWVLLEARAIDDNSLVVETKAALLLENGEIVSPDGAFGVTFDNLAQNESYSFSVKTRNHLAVCAAIPLQVPNAESFEFSQPGNVEGGQNQLANFGDGNWGLLSGDFDSNGIITVADYNLYESQASLINIYTDGDCNLDKSVTIADFNLYQQNTSRVGVSCIRY